MAGGKRSKSYASDKEERLFAREQILGSRDTIDNMFLQSQNDQLAAIDSAISGAQGYASTQANAQAAASGLGVSNIDGTMAYVLNNLVPQAMQMKAGIYGNTAQQRAGSIEDYLQLLNQNASLSAYSKGGKKGTTGGIGFSQKEGLSGGISFG